MQKLMHPKDFLTFLDSYGGKGESFQKLMSNVRNVVKPWRNGNIVKLKE
jgi:hypothetical protein